MILDKECAFIGMLVFVYALLATATVNNRDPIFTDVNSCEMFCKMIPKEKGSQEKLYPKYSQYIRKGNKCRCYLNDAKTYDVYNDQGESETGGPGLLYGVIRIPMKMPSISGPRRCERFCKDISIQSGTEVRKYPKLSMFKRDGKGEACCRCYLPDEKTYDEYKKTKDGTIYICFTDPDSQSKLCKPFVQYRDNSLNALKSDHLTYTQLVRFQGHFNSNDDLQLSPHKLITDGKSDIDNVEATSSKTENVDSSPVSQESLQPTNNRPHPQSTHRQQLIIKEQSVDDDDNVEATSPNTEISDTSLPNQENGATPILNQEIGDTPIPNQENSPSTDNTVIRRASQNYRNEHHRSHLRLTTDEQSDVDNGKAILSTSENSGTLPINKETSQSTDNLPNQQTMHNQRQHPITVEQSNVNNGEATSSQKRQVNSSGKRKEPNANEKSDRQVITLKSFPSRPEKSSCNSYCKDIGYFQGNFHPPTSCQCFTKDNKFSVYSEGRFLYSNGRNPNKPLNGDEPNQPNQSPPAKKPKTRLSMSLNPIRRSFSFKRD